MKKQLIFSSLLLKGFSSVIIQTLLMRELFIVFYGNELTFSIILSVWLIAGAIGSGFIGNLFKNPFNAIRPYCLFQILLSIWLPLAIILIRTSKVLLGVSFAEAFGIGHIVIISILSLLWLALSDGALFNIGFRLVSSVSGPQESSVAKIYLLESLGVIVGGMAFTFIFLTIFNSFQIAFLISVLNLLCCSLLLTHDKNKWLKAASWLIFLNFLGLYVQSPIFQKLTLAQQWQKKHIVAYENSVYGNIAVSQELSQYTIFYDGLPTISIPMPETYFTEDFIHIPLLAKPNARKILFVGNAVGGLLAEALKYPVSKIVYVELDPVFIKIIQSLKEPTTEKELKDPRVNIQLTDGRNYVKSTSERFDCVFVNTGLPTSLAINRYYTKEFFAEVRRILGPDGIAVFKTWGSLAYLSDELKKINASLLKTLSSIFAYVDVVPGDGFNIFIASRQKPNLDAGYLAKNWRVLNLKTYLINPVYLQLRLQKPYLEWFYASIKDEIKRVSINQDLKPTGLYEGLSLYYAQFSKKIPKVFSGFKKVKPAHLPIALILFFIFWRLFSKRKDMRAMTLNFTVLSTGFFAMSIQIIVLFLFQSLLGYLFQWLAILTTSFMVGASLGATYANKKLKLLTDYKKLSRMELTLPVATGLFMLLPIVFFGKNIGWSFSLISILAGFLVGLEIPIVYHLYIKSANLSKISPSKIAGQLYCLDLIGACLGALVAPLVLIPSCGIPPTVLILCLLKIGNSWNVSKL